MLLVAAMTRVMVISGAIRAVEYDDAHQHLDVELTSGRVYRYLEVGPEAFAAFMQARSKGRFYNDHIRDVYLYERLR
jgi:hypothetical protein